MECNRGIMKCENGFEGRNQAKLLNTPVKLPSLTSMLQMSAIRMLKSTVCFSLFTSVLNLSGQIIFAHQIEDSGCLPLSGT